MRKIHIPDLSGKIAIVTGANSGLGYETTRSLAANNAQVIMACRSAGKGEIAARQIRNENPEANVEVMPLDLADLTSVRAFVQAFTRKNSSLDILCNNAGVMALPEKYKTADGFEMQFGTNHLGHFALTGLLLELIKSTPGARIVAVSSFAHKMGKVDFENLNAGQSYKKWTVYGMTKLANLLFTYELQRRFESAGQEAIAVAAHPGYAATNLQRYSGIFSFLNRFIAQKPEMGALPIIHAATAPEVRGGDFFGPDGFGELRGYPKKVESGTASHDETVARRLWEVSEELTKVHYHFEI